MTAALSSIRRLAATKLPPTRPPIAVAMCPSFSCPTCWPTCYPSIPPPAAPHRRLLPHRHAQVGVLVFGCSTAFAPGSKSFVVSRFLCGFAEGGGEASRI